MSVILVIDPDISYAESMAVLLRGEGWTVELASDRDSALASAAATAPGLVIGNGSLPESADIFSAFARRNGGPGVIVMLPITVASRVTAEDYRADEVLTKPFSEDTLKERVRAYLQHGTEQDLDSKQPGQLTSEDIFGDVLEELERDAKKPKTRPAPRMDDQLERRLEQTLTGVLDLETLRRQARLDKIEDVRQPSRPDIGSPSPGAAASGLSSQHQHPPHQDERPSLPTSAPWQERAGAPAAGSGAATDTPSFSADASGGASSQAEHEPASTPIPDKPFPATTGEADTGSTSGNAIPSSKSASWGQTEGTAADLGADLGPDLESLLPGKDSLHASPTATQRSQDAKDDVDRLLDETLSGLVIPSRPVTQPAAGAAESHQEPAVVSPPSEDAAASSASETAPSEERGSADGLPALAVPSSEKGQGETQLAENGLAFGDYTLLERIAVGGMAEVWKARRRGVEGFRKTVAIKKILSHLTSSPDFVTMFIDEAKLAAQLSHNHIIQIYDLGKVGEDFFIAMEFVDGKDLRSILAAAQEKDRPLPMALALMIGARLARALDYAHRLRDFEDRELGLVHRDVSPQNVLISYEGDIKLCDFGIVKAVAKASHTQMGALKGKLQYMSPEQAWGRSVDPRSDIFSLGSVLYELLTGEQLFAEESELAVLDAVRECRYAKPRSVAPDIPVEVEGIVLQALARTPDERFQSAEELALALEESLSSLGMNPGSADLASYLRNLVREGANTAERAALDASEARLLRESPSAEVADSATFEAPSFGAEIAAPDIAAPASVAAASATPASATPDSATPDSAATPGSATAAADADDTRPTAAEDVVSARAEPGPTEPKKAASTEATDTERKADEPEPSPAAPAVAPSIEPSALAQPDFGTQRFDVSALAAEHAATQAEAQSQAQPSVVALSDSAASTDTAATTDQAPSTVQPASEGDQEAAKSRWPWILLIILVLLAAAAWWYLQYGPGLGGRDGAAPSGTPAESTTSSDPADGASGGAGSDPAAATEANPATGPDAGTPDADGQAPGAATSSDAGTDAPVAGNPATGADAQTSQPGQGAADSTADDGAAETGATGSGALPADLEQQVEDALNRRAEELRRSFEAERQRLEQELQQERQRLDAANEAAQGTEQDDEAAPPPPPGPGGGR